MTKTEPPSTSTTLAALPHHGLAMRLVCVCFLLTGWTLGCSMASAQAVPPPGWHLVWSDEFNGAGGASPDPAKWAFDLGGSGNGNNELETYTNRPANVQQRGGNLMITASREDHTGADGIPRSYTSGRIKTQGRFAQAYGRFEARIRLPLGKGIWPAFWMLGNDVDSVNWPGCGEIDIFENIGNAGLSYSTLHGPGYSGAKGISAKFALPAGESVATAFHVYAVEWTPGDIKFFLDGRLVAEQTPADLPAGARWVFDHPFFLILNVAVGGSWPGNPDATTIFPQRMLVDYVRVYSRDSPVATRPEGRGR